MMTNDGQALAFFNMQLTHIESAIYKKQYPEKVWDKIIPVDTSADPLAKTVTYYVGDRTGKAKLGANLLADDIPIVNVNRAKNEVPIIEATVGYRYSIIEVMQARKLGINLAADEATAARDAYEDEMEDLALSGFSPARDFSADASSRATASRRSSRLGSSSSRRMTSSPVAPLNGTQMALPSSSNSMRPWPSRCCSA